jgi:hypothetical protein
MHKYPYILVIAGAVLMAVFMVLSMSTGMWGCGPTCHWFIVAFWLSVGVFLYGIWLVIAAKRKKGNL